MEGPISFWRYKEQESNLILPEHDDDDVRFCQFVLSFCVLKLNDNGFKYCNYDTKLAIHLY